MPFKTNTMPKACLWVCLLFLPFALLAQQKITGKVINNADKQPVVGATVQVKGSKTATSTSLDGSFTINAAGNSNLIISSVGYDKQEIPVGGRSTIGEIALTIATSALNEIVVTGYSTQKKKDITGSVAVVDVKSLKSVPSGTAESLLQGQASGVTLIESVSELTPPAASVTVAVLTSRCAAELATRTVIVIGGYDDLPDRASPRRQVRVVVPEHDQPGPDAATGPAPKPALLISAESPAGRTSVTVVAPPSVACFPLFLTTSVRVPACTVVLGSCARRNVAVLWLVAIVRCAELAADADGSGIASEPAATTSAMLVRNMRPFLSVRRQPRRNGLPIASSRLCAASSPLIDQVNTPRKPRCFAYCDLIAIDCGSS